jgi:hypothetical protein
MKIISQLKAWWKKVILILFAPKQDAQIFMNAGVEKQLP